MKATMVTKVVRIYLGSLLLSSLASAHPSYYPVLPNRIASNKHTIIHRRKRSLQSSTLTFISKITASDGETNNYFGNYNAVAISNSRIVVGASGYKNSIGAAYLFMDPANPSSGRSYSQMAILTASDGEKGDWFGTSVDIDGDIIVVGASEFDSNGNGAVYIFRIGDNDVVSQIAKITAQNGVTYDYFSWHVAIHGKFILVGAYGVDENGSTDVGSAYLFVNPSTDSNNPEWTQIMQFQPNDLTASDWFGVSVAMEDQIAVIGTSDSSDANAAYVFVPVDENVNSLSLWTQMAKLTGPTDSVFGYSVAVAGNTIVVGARSDDNINGIDAGAIFVFTKINDSSSSSSSWTQTNILLASDGADSDYFGTSVSISKDSSTIVVGANYDDYSSTIIESGAAYLFRNSNTTTTPTVGWTQVGKYVADDRDTYDYLGSSIAIENSVVAVGAYGDDSNTGSAYILGTENSPPTTTTTAPIQTTTSPTPTTMAPTGPNKGDDNNNPSSPPATLTPATGVPATPTPPNNNFTSNPRDSPADDTNPSSDSNNVIMAAIGGAVVVILGLGFFYFRLKKDRLRLVEQQQQQQQIIPQTSSGNNGVAAVHIDETPIIADAVFLPIQSAEDRTMAAEVVSVDPSLTQAPPIAAAAAVGNMNVIDTDKGRPRYKDKLRTIGRPVGPSHIPTSEPSRNSQRNGDQEEMPGTEEVQQRQQLHDPPANVNLFQEWLPTFKDQVLGE